MILAVASSATVLSSCSGDNIPEIPVETVVGSQGEILGVSVYTEEHNSETQTILYEITTKKTKANKTKKSDKTDSESKSEDTNNDTISRKMTVRNNSSGVTIKPPKKNESTSRVRPTFPPTAAPKTTREAATFATKETTKHVPISYVPETEKPKATNKPVQTTLKQTQAQTRAETAPVYDEKVSEKSDGINVVFKTDTVEKGKTASVMIQGAPGKKYSIDFYISPTETADYSDLADQTADENGFVTWTFDIPSNCSTGSKKIVVKENGSNNFAQTSINVK